MWFVGIPGEKERRNSAGHVQRCVCAETKVSDNRGSSFSTSITVHVYKFSLYARNRKVANGLKQSAIHVETTEEDELHRTQSPHKCIELILPAPSSLLSKLKANTSAQVRTVVVEYANDACKDVFQLGRAVNGGNDFILPGVLHVDDEGCTTGPVSRWACRVECERLPPFRSFIYAGGFDPIRKVSILLVAPNIDLYADVHPRTCHYCADHSSTPRPPGPR